MTKLLLINCALIINRSFTRFSAFYIAVPISDLMFFGRFDWQWKDQGRIDCHQILDPTLRTYHKNHYHHIQFNINTILTNCTNLSVPPFQPFAAN